MLQMMLMTSERLRLLPFLMLLPTWVTVLASVVTAFATGMLAFYARQQQLIEQRRVEREESPHLVLYFDETRAARDSPVGEPMSLMLLNLSPNSVVITNLWASWQTLSPGFVMERPSRFESRKMLRSGEAQRLYRSWEADEVQAPRMLLKVRFLYALTQSKVHCAAWEVEPQEGQDPAISSVAPDESTRM